VAYKTDEPACDQIVTEPQQNIEEVTEMDTRYINKRSGVWYTDFCFPAKIGGDLANKRIRMSLETANYKAAASFRDQYILPLLTVGRERDLIRSLVSMLYGASEHAAELADEFLTTVGLELTDTEATRPAGRIVPLRQLGERYITYLKSTDLAPASVRKYRSTVSGMCTIFGEAADAETFSDEDMATFRDTLLQTPVNAKGKRMSANTVSRELQRARTFFQWAIDDGKLRRPTVPGPKVKIQKIEPKQKVSPTVEQADQLCVLAKPERIDCVSWKYLPWIARYSGCRISEIATLTVDDIVVEQDLRCLSIGNTNGHRTKTQSSVRLIPIADKLAPYIDELLAMCGKGRLFPDCGDWTGNDGTYKPAHYFLKAWNRAAKSVGADLSFHCWRVYANDQMTSAEIDIIDRERILGHKSDRTQAAYTTRELNRYSKAVNAIP